MADSNAPVFTWFPDDTLESELEKIPLHVLIAEDDAATRNLLSKALQKYGYRVSLAENGTNAWEMLDDPIDPPELALLDWMMPGLDGPEICRRLKERKRPFVFAILLTARCNDADIVTGLEAGAHEFLTKPFNLHVLAARVAAGARIVRLEKRLLMKTEVLQKYVQKLEG